MVVTGCLALVADDTPKYLPWLQAQRAAGKLVVVDANLRPAIVPDMAAYQASVMAALGEADIKSIEDLAGCATDDLVGWTERKQGGSVKHEGAFTGLDVSSDEANDFIMRARVAAGWIEPPAEEEELEEAGEGDADEQAGAGA